jgi:hypothetical protein
LDRDQAGLNKAVEERINAIMRLRAEQTGPLHLLQMMDGKMPADSLFRLTSITQTKAEKDKNESFAIAGYSPNEAQVTSFAKNLEFSDGWFSNFTLEIARGTNPESGKEMAPPSTNANTPTKGKTPPKEPKEVAKEVVRFTIKCSYNPQNLLVNPTPATEPGKEQPGSTPTAPNKAL